MASIDREWGSHFLIDVVGQPYKGHESNEVAPFSEEKMLDLLQDLGINLSGFDFKGLDPMEANDEEDKAFLLGKPTW